MKTRTMLKPSLFVVAAALLLAVSACQSSTPADAPAATAPSAAAEAPAAAAPAEVPAEAAEGATPPTGEAAAHDEHAGHGAAGEQAGEPAAHAAGEGHGEMDHVLSEGDFDPSQVVAQPGAVAGDIVRCPVSGEAFVVDAAGPHVMHEGKPVYFCCAQCIRRFQRSPEQHLEGQGS